MKKTLFILLTVIVFFHSPCLVDADEAPEINVSMSSGTAGDVKYTLYEFDGTNCTNKVISGMGGRMLSAPTYQANYDEKNTGEAYCLQPNFGGPSTSGLTYHCEASGADYASILNNDLDPQSKEYAIKLAAAANGVGNGVIVSSHSSADSNGYPIYGILSAAGSSALNSTTKVNVDGKTYCVKVNDDSSGTYSSALGAYSSWNGASNSGTLGGNTDNGFKITSKYLKCSSGKCQATINYTPVTAKITSVKGKGISGVSSNNGVITFSASGSEECVSISVTISYEGAAGWSLCTIKGGNTEMQHMLVEQPSNGKIDVNLSDGCSPSEGCQIEGSPTTGCIEKGEIKEPTNFKTCIFGKTDCLTESYDEHKNDYCTISCKENITLEFPTKITGPNGETGMTFSGRYFNLTPNTRITGEKICAVGGTTTNNYAYIEWDKFLDTVYGSKTNDANYGGLDKEQRENYNIYILNKQLYDDLNNKVGMKSVSTTCVVGYERVEVPCESQSALIGGGTSTPTERDEDEVCYERVEIKENTMKVSYKTNRYTTSTTGSKQVEAFEYSNKNCIDKGDYEIVKSSIASLRDQAQSTYLAAQDNIEKAFADIKECTEKLESMSYKFEPKATFEYDEPYNKNINYSCALTQGPDISEASYCLGEASDPDYKCSGDSSPNKKNSTLYNCVEGVKDCKDRTSSAIGIDVYYYRYKAAREVLKAVSECSNSTSFYTKIPSGVMTTSSSGNTIALGTIYPVSASTVEGNYEYDITVSNLGENAKFDRCLGLSKAICNYQVVNEIEIVEPCPEPPCPQKPSCTGSNCKNTYEAGVNYFYRPIDLNNVFPHSNTNNSNKFVSGHYRTTGSNWQNAKGLETEADIEKMGNEVYKQTDNIDGENIRTYEYSYTITPRQMKAIRDYNDQQENLGGYADFDLKCSENGLECVSSFLSSKNGQYFTDNINPDPVNRTVTFAQYTDGTAWK